MGKNSYSKEKTLRDTEKVVGEVKRKSLERSKVLSLWLKFYLEWFCIKDINLVDICILHEIGKKAPGTTTVLVPKGLTLATFFGALEEKGLVECKIENPDDVIENIRRKNTGYVLHEKSKFTLLEELLIEMFNVYQTGEFLPYGHWLVGEYFTRRSRSLSTKGKCISISSNSKDGKRVSLIVREENF